MGQKTIAEAAQEIGIPIDQAIAKLKNQGIDTNPQENVRALADRIGKRPLPRFSSDLPQVPVPDEDRFLPRRSDRSTKILQHLGFRETQQRPPPTKIPSFTTVETTQEDSFPWAAETVYQYDTIDPVYEDGFGGHDLCFSRLGNYRSIGSPRGIVSRSPW